MARMLPPVSMMRSMGEIIPPEPPPTSPHTLTYESDGDDNGLFHFLGRNFNVSPTWVNPHTAGRVIIGAFNSSNAADLGEGTLAGPVNRDNTDSNRTNNAAGSYWRFDLPAEQSIAVSVYSFRCREPGQGDASNIASLKFQGSNDGSSWTDLATETGITYGGASEQWKVFTVTGAAAYRYHRILHQGNVTGANSFFFLSEIELYGVVTWAALANSANFNWVSDGDANGVIRFIGKNFNPAGTWTNPHTASRIVVTKRSDVTGDPTGAGTAETLVDTGPNDNYVGNVANNYFAVDLGTGCTLVVSKYTARNRDGPGVEWANRALRNWRLQGSNNAGGNTIANLDGATWENIDIRVGDATMSATDPADFATYTPNQSNTTPYRWIRLYQDGTNALGDHYLAVCEIEFYGTFTWPD